MGPELLQRKLALRVPTVGLPSSDLSLKEIQSSKSSRAKRVQAQRDQVICITLEAFNIGFFRQA